jgi:hypothetical protein
MRVASLAAVPILLAALSADARRPASVADWVEMEVRDVYPAHHGQSNVVLLKTKRGERFLPIWIGTNEALAISLRLAGRNPPRPLTHDLLERLLRSLGAKIVKIHIEDIRGHVFLGRIFLKGPRGTVDIDARPSDSIALAVGARAPIFAARPVLDRAGVSDKDLRVMDRPEPREPKPRIEGSL